MGEEEKAPQVSPEEAQLQKDARAVAELARRGLKNKQIESTLGLIPSRRAKAVRKALELGIMPDADERRIAHWRDPQHRETATAKLRKGARRPEVRAKKSQNAKDYWKNLSEEGRSDRSQITREQWAGYSLSQWEEMAQKIRTGRRNHPPKKKQKP